MEPAPRPALEVIQGQLLLHLLVALLHRPATPPQTYRAEPRGAGRQVAEGVLPLAIGLLLDQQPDRIGEGAVAVGPALTGPDPQPGEMPRQLPLGPLTPRHLPQRCPRR